jgi:hypothetical protein
MITKIRSLDTFNAKKMTPSEVASSFVVPNNFTTIASSDHCYVIGPRGSGKTTILRMLTGQNLTAWKAREASEIRHTITYSSIFLPADELWASQTNQMNARAAFTTQMLYAFVESMIYRSTADASHDSPTEVHLGVTLGHDEEVHLAEHCASAWGLKLRNRSLFGLQDALDLVLAGLTQDIMEGTPIGGTDSMTLLAVGVRAFNRAAHQPGHLWALLLDEMELAPAEIHQQIISFVRGGSADIIVKVSMSPFDRYMNSYGAGGQPIPGHDFQTIYLPGQTRPEIARFTKKLWTESMRARGLSPVPIDMALTLGDSTRYSESSVSSGGEVIRRFKKAQAQDRDFSSWLASRSIDLDHPEKLSYDQRSATIRKVDPLLIFREALLSFRNGRPVRRSRKKPLELFTGSSAVITMLEGNPRWIKSAFSDMLDYYDSRTQTVSPGFQFDAIVALSTRFESLLRVLPRRTASKQSIAVTELVDQIARHFNEQNTSKFNPDPQNCFTVDRSSPPAVIDALVMGLYAGAFVHVRDRKSPAVLSDFRGQRFRLAYLLSIRDGKEFPLRLGKDVRLSAILDKTTMAKATVDSKPKIPLQLGFDI